MKALNLQEKYDPIAEDLNVFNWLTQKYTTNSRTMRFKPEYAKNPGKFQEWQKALKAKVIELLGISLEKSELNLESGAQVDFKGVTMKKIYYTSQPGLKVPAVLSYPTGLREKRPAVIALHGHNFGKINSLGFAYSSSHSYYGFQLAQRGFVTLSLDQWGWGERYGVAKKRRNGAESMYSLTALLLGLTAVGIRVWDVMRGFDFLETLDIVDSSRLATIGQSGGGTTSLFASALDDRVTAAVISGYFCSLYDSIFSINHCACNFVPQLLLWADLPEIVGIRAPKPTFIISGEKDGIFPQNGVQKAYGELHEIYRAANAEPNLGIDVWGGHGHEFRGEYAYPWLEKHLNQK